MFGYRNKGTGQVVVYTEKNPRLEALNEWESADPSQVPRSAAEGIARATAERSSIQGAAAIRFDTATGKAAGAVAEAAARETTPAGDAAGALPTLSTMSGSPEQASSLVGLLEKEDPARRVDAIPFEENRRRAQHEIENPPTDGVLARAKRDQRAGLTQIGPDPQEHVQPMLAEQRPQDEVNQVAKAGGVAPASGSGADGGEPEGEAEGGEEEPAPPAASATKAEWVRYAVDVREADEGEATGMTKAQLVEQYGA